MATIISTAFMSLDGVVEAPGGEPGYRNSGWTFQDIDFVEDAYAMKSEEQSVSDAMLLGRHSYQSFAPIWPGMTEEFPRYNALPKFVVSTTLDESDLVNNWGATTILRSIEDVATLKSHFNGTLIIHGSATLTRALTDAGLIDRYHLLVFPVLLGAGKRLFSTTDKPKKNLKLLSAETYSNGIQKLVYEA
ncbi:dihydrofolate reductase family protein [Devosia sp. WQ 349]|uniref:dihydrofolate reductase family protein n=1 Tax=Devosia sp. WQ 349K1 TaxID=2800329 RepID=UPI001905FDC2|nr:dihydrofolate reductase family protein [Devosia sp. WQ 349K1]MBK1794925.1 dihydrofolate reductase family protein [Devosia sp. WQ 349K1]